MHISQKIKTLRKSAGYSQEDVSAHLGIKRSTYASYETGRIELPTELLQPVSELLGVEMKLLVDKSVSVEKGAFKSGVKIKTESDLAQSAMVDVLMEEIAKLRSEKEKRPMIDILKELNESANLRAVQLSKHLTS